KCTSRRGLPVSGSRTWPWTMAAPALAASLAESAICLGERGTCGLRSCDPPEPVTAQVMKTSRLMASGILVLPMKSEADHCVTCGRVLCDLRKTYDQKRKADNLSFRARAPQGDTAGLFRLVHHVRGLRGRSAARRQPHRRRDA